MTVNALDMVAVGRSPLSSRAVEPMWAGDVVFSKAHRSMGVGRTGDVAEADKTGLGSLIPSIPKEEAT